jgi:hypothetical protein
MERSSGIRADEWEATAADDPQSDRRIPGQILKEPAEIEAREPYPSPKGEDSSQEKTSTSHYLNSTRHRSNPSHRAPTHNGAQRTIEHRPRGLIPPSPADNSP